MTDSLFWSDLLHKEPEKVTYSCEVHGEVHSFIALTPTLKICEECMRNYLATNNIQEVHLNKPKP